MDDIELQQVDVLVRKTAGAHEEGVHMEYVRMDFWEILLHLLGMLLWCMTILYLIKDRWDRKNRSSRGAIQNRMKDFGDEMDFQLIKQQAETALETLSETINRERLVLRNLIEGRETEEKNGSFSREKSKLPMKRPLPAPKARRPQTSAAAVQSDPYEEVVRLSGLGMSEKEISAHVGLPKSEIALIRKLNDYVANSDAETAQNAATVCKV